MGAAGCLPAPVRLSVYRCLSMPAPSQCVRLTLFRSLSVYGSLPLRVYMPASVSLVFLCYSLPLSMSLLASLYLSLALSISVSILCLLLFLSFISQLLSLSPCICLLLFLFVFLRPSSCPRVYFSSLFCFSGSLRLLISGHFSVSLCLSVAVSLSLPVYLLASLFLWPLPLSCHSFSLSSSDPLLLLLYARLHQFINRVPLRVRLFIRLCATEMPTLVHRKRGAVP